MLRWLTKLLYVPDMKGSDRALNKAVYIFLEGLRKNTKYVRIAGVPDEIRIGSCCYINLSGNPTKLQTNRYIYVRQNEIKNTQRQYQTNTDKCIHILKSDHFIKTKGHSNMFQLFRGHLQGVSCILHRGSNCTAAAIHKICCTVHWILYLATHVVELAARMHQIYSMKTS